MKSFLLGVFIGIIGLSVFGMGKEALLAGSIVLLTILGLWCSNLLVKTS